MYFYVLKLILGDSKVMLFFVLVHSCLIWNSVTLIFLVPRPGWHPQYFLSGLSTR